MHHNPNPLTPSIAQAFVLGSLLFLLYINEMTDNLSHLSRLVADVISFGAKFGFDGN